MMGENIKQVSTLEVVVMVETKSPKLWNGGESFIYVWFDWSSQCAIVEKYLLRTHYLDC